MKKPVLNFNKEGLNEIREVWRSKGYILFNMDNEIHRKLFVSHLNVIFENENFDHLLEDDYLLKAFVEAFGVDSNKKISMVEVYDNLEREADNGSILYARTA